MKSPFKFLDYFTIADRDAFFGREDEARQLFEMVNQNRLVLVYGQSGTGKTSLVQCGLASQFNVTDWMPVFVRREADMNESLRAALFRALRTEPSGIPLLDVVQNVYTRYLRPVYIIFDQFEELFILGGKEEQEKFIEQIAELYKSDASCQMLFIIREEYLALLYDLEKTIPTLFDRRLRVEPMSAAKVQIVLKESFRRFNIELEDPRLNLRQIIGKVSGEKSVIQLPYLQVYLDQLWREDYERTYTRLGITPKDSKYPPLLLETREIEEFGAIGDVLAKYLDNQKTTLQSKLDARYDGLKGNEVARLLDVFVTSKGTKRPVGINRKGKFVELQGIPSGVLDDLPPNLIHDGLAIMEESRILRSDGQIIELAHDKLAELIENYRTEDDRKLASDLQLIEAAYEAHLKTGDYMSRKALHVVEDSLPKLKLTEEQHLFIQESAEESIRTEDLARAEALQRAKDAEERASLAERAKKRARWLSYGALAFCAAITVFFIYTQQLNKRLSQERLRAEDAKYREMNALAEKARTDQTYKQYYYGVIVFDLINEDIENMQYEAAYQKLLDIFNIAVQRDTSGAILSIDSLRLRPDLKDEFPRRQIASRLFEVSFFFKESNQLKREKILIDTLISFVGFSPKKFEAHYAKMDSFLRADTLSLSSFEDSTFAYCVNKYLPRSLLVPGGTLAKGCNGPDCESDELPVVSVSIDTFLMGVTEITNHQYNIFLKAKNRSIKEVSPTGWFIKGSCPVVKLDWYDAVSYCNWLSERLGISPYYNINKNKDPLNDRKKDPKKWIVTTNKESKGFRLPTESEWEYAARGGHTEHIFAGGNAMDSLGWCRENSGNTIHPVAQKKPNAFGLFDMSGNAAEWCWDWYHHTGYAISADSLEKTVKYARVHRGGSWNHPRKDCQVFSRIGYNEKTLLFDEIKYPVIGFRIARGR